MGIILGSKLAWGIQGKQLRPISKVKRVDNQQEPHTRDIIKQYSAGTLIDRIGAYYDDEYYFSDEDKPIDLTAMTRIELLELQRAKKDQLAAFLHENPNYDPSEQDSGTDDGNGE